MLACLVIGISEVASITAQRAVLKSGAPHFLRPGRRPLQPSLRPALRTPSKVESGPIFSQIRFVSFQGTGCARSPSTSGTQNHQRVQATCGAPLTSASPPRSGRHGAPVMRGNGGFDLGQLVPAVLLIALFASGAWVWVFAAINGLVLFTLAIALLAPPALEWWLSRNLVEGTCPDCGTPQQVLKGQPSFQCQVCGTRITSERSESGVLMREGMANEDGLVDVAASVDTDSR